MAVEIPNSLNCLGAVKGSDGTKLSGAGFSPNRFAKGVYTLTLDQPVDGSQCSANATLRGGSAGMIELEHTSASVKTVKTFDNTGAAADSNFDFQILNCPNS